MTWANLIATGSGSWRFRLEVEGWPVSWVTHSAMANLAASPPRKVGLAVSGGKLKCVANIVTGELDVSGFSCTVSDINETPTYDLARTPTATTWLMADMTAAATAMSVRSTAGFATSGTVWLDSETIHYGAKTSTTFTGCTRGGYSTLGQKHYIGAGGLLRYPEVTDLPVTMAGRRARLYAYGRGDTPTGTGTLLWLGIVSRHPTFQGAAWAISVDPITSVLSRALSADLAEPCTPRGIYYPWNRPFQMLMRIAVSGTAVPGGDPGDSQYIVFPRTASDTAFFETNDDFVDYLNDKISAATAGWDTSVVAEADGDSGWHLKATTDGTPTAVWFSGPGGIDPDIGPARDESGTIVTTFAASTTYTFRGDMATSQPGAGSVPRGGYGDVVPVPGLGNPALAATFPNRRIYLSGAASISSLTTAAAIAWKEWFTSTEVDELASVISSNSTDRWIELSRPSLDSITHYGHQFVAGAEPEIRLGRTYTTSGSVWTAISAIIAAAPNEINAGSVPDIRSGDFDSTAWAELDELWQPRIVRERRFDSFADVSLGDLAKEELKLAGYALGLNGSGQMAPFRLRRPVATEAGAVAVPSFQVNKSVPTWAPSNLGMVNQVLVRRGYEPVEDEYTQATDIVRDVTAFGQSPRPRTLMIEPKSRPAGEVESHLELVELAARIFSVLAYPYAIVHGDQGFKQLGTLTGDVAAITSPHLPNHSDGSVGVTDLAALVIGREIDLSTGLISSTYYVPLQRSAGYAPEAKVTAQADLGGNLWEIDLDTYTFPGGTSADDWFLVGDGVRIVRWDSTTAGVVAGQISAAAGNTVEVQFEDPWTPGSDTWFLSYDTSNSSLVQASQLIYVYLASSAGRIDAATDLDAWGFA